MHRFQLRHVSALFPLSLSLALLAACPEAPDDQDAGQQDAGQQDAGQQDAGQQDAGQQDAGQQDAGQQDAGQQDAGETDAGETDAGETDAGEDDAGSADAGEVDAGGSDAGESDAGSSNLECIFNDDCPANERCECENFECLCRIGARGTGVNGVDVCVNENDCASALCFEGQDLFYCSGECETDDDCGPALPRCIPIAFVGQVCAREPPEDP